MTDSHRIINVEIERSVTDKDKFDKSNRYQIELVGKNSVLNILDHIAEHIDPSLSYYSSCRIGKCAGCQVRINGKVQLACTTMVEGDLKIEPLSGFKVIRDLVVDKTQKSEK